MSPIGIFMIIYSLIVIVPGLGFKPLTLRGKGLGRVQKDALAFSVKMETSTFGLNTMDKNFENL